MQSLEWLTFDNFLHMRPEEPIDERIVIVGINEEDIRQSIEESFLIRLRFSCIAVEIADLSTKSYWS